MLKFALIALAGSLLFTLRMLWLRKKRMQQLKEKLRRQWGQVQDNDIRFHLVERYSLAADTPADQLHFDHLIRKGPLTTRNAIKILEMNDYPASVISEASAISQKLTLQKDMYQKG